jgi:hypothetical protein
LVIDLDRKCAASAMPEAMTMAAIAKAHEIEHDQDEREATEVGAPGAATK